MIRNYKADPMTVLLSDLRFLLLTVRNAIPDIAAGIALVVLLVLLPIAATLIL